MRAVDMDLAKNNEHEAIVNGVADVAHRFGDDYWLLREVTVTRIAPITAQLIMCFIAAKVLDQPKSC